MVRKKICLQPLTMAARNPSMFWFAWSSESSVNIAVVMGTAKNA